MYIKSIKILQNIGTKIPKINQKNIKKTHTNIPKFGLKIGIFLHIFRLIFYLKMSKIWTKFHQIYTKIKQIYIKINILQIKKYNQFHPLLK